MKRIPFPFRWPKRGDTGLEDQCKRKKYLHILAHHIILRDNSHVEVPIGREREGVFRAAVYMAAKKQLMCVGRYQKENER